jgi:hypothetical protein
MRRIWSVLLLLDKSRRPRMLLKAVRMLLTMVPSANAAKLQMQIC